MTTIEETERAVSTAPPLEWLMPGCPVCAEQVEPMLDGASLQCRSCGLWWTRDGQIGRAPSDPCGQHARDSELSCIRRDGHVGDHAAYDQLGTGSTVVRWSRSPLEQIGDALRQRRALEMSGEDFEMLVSDILEREGVR